MERYLLPLLLNPTLFLVSRRKKNEQIAHLKLHTGNITNGVYEAANVIAVTSSTSMGTWNIRSITITDRAGPDSPNVRNLTQNALETQGIT
jgi:hypothetical protein